MDRLKLSLSATMLLMTMSPARSDDRDIIRGFDKVDSVLKKDQRQSCDIDTANQIKINDVVGCNFLKRRADYPFLKEKWTLDFSGADLLRSHPILKEAQYKKTKVAIIDSGFRFNGNPAAGQKILNSSPEEKAGGHGVGCAGILASKEYGVNPDIELVQISIASSADEASNSVEDKSISSFKKVLADPDVKVVSVSMGFSAKPELMALMREALNHGKWIVLAGGNRAALLPQTSDTFAGLRSNPGFFVASGLSYFAGPDRLLFGPEVDFFSPTALGESLNPAYQKPGDTVWSEFGGTSSATPHQAGVLATMRAIYPELDIKNARKILNITAIQRGSNPKTLQMNDYHAVELLARAKACLQKMSSTTCIEDAETEIQSANKAASELAEPQMATCAQWSQYYDNLRKSYFLSNADKTSTNKLQSFWAHLAQPDWAENYYFIERRTIGPHPKLGQFDPKNNQQIKEDYLHAQRFFDGEFATVTDGTLPPPQKADLDSYYIYLFGRLASTEANAIQFVKACPFRKISDARAHSICSNYVNDMPSSMFKKMIELLEKQNQPLITNAAMILRQMEWRKDRLNLTNYDKTRKRLVHLYLQGWLNAKAGLNDVRELVNYFDLLSTSDQNQLLKGFKSKMASGAFEIEQNGSTETTKILYQDLLSKRRLK